MQRIEFNRSTGNPLVMGILNVTHDSFSDGGTFLQPRAAIAHGLRLLHEGADIVDVGGESTRPPGSAYGAGSAVISVDEELARVITVIEGIHAERPDAVLSIDTVKPEVAEAAVRAGASVVNDVSGGRYDEAIWSVAARYDVPYVLMHGHDPHDRRRVDEIHYDDVTEEVTAFLRERSERAGRMGVRRIIVDPGIGFGKGAADSMRLIRELSRLRSLDLPILVGASRKSFIGRALGGLPPEERLNGTLAAHAVAALHGASVIRVHDVQPAVQFIRLFAPLIGAG